MQHLCKGATLFLILTFCLNDVIAQGSDVKKTPYKASYKPFNIAITPSVEIINGIMDELVYAAAYKSGGESYKYPSGERKLSELNWKIVNLFMIDLDITFSCGIFDFSLYGAAGIPRNTGIMRDSDFLNISDEDMKVCYSESDCDIKGAYRLGTKFRTNIDVAKWLLISPAAFIQYNYWDFKTDDTAECWYGNNQNEYVPYNDPSAKHYKKGDKLGIGIDYTKHEIFSYIGCEFCFKPAAGLMLWHNIFVSPLFITSSIDHHHGGNRYYKDITFGPWRSFSFETAIGYRFAKKFLLKVQARYDLTLNTKGISLYSSDGTGDDDSYYPSSPDQSKAGVAMETVGVTISFEYKIF